LVLSVCDLVSEERVSFCPPVKIPERKKMGGKKKGE